ncbi:hypothetical protein GBA52_011811 [Prunus armeniaca]|nr:hypothetical protein GBA52_011811 [Prunus armeniaca]
MEKLGQIDGKRRRSAQRNLAAVPPCLGLRNTDVAAIFKEEKREGVKTEEARSLARRHGF